MPAHIKYKVKDGHKDCGSCGRNLPVSQFRKARRHFTAACRECLSRYAKAYRQRLDVKDKSREYHKAYTKTNKEAVLARNRRWRRTDKAKATKNAWRRHWAANEKRKAVKYKGGECQKCGYSDCLAALDFHHLDPTVKEGYNGGALRQHWTFEKNKAELDKCVLLCCRCHREIHAEELHSEHISGVRI